MTKTRKNPNEQLMENVLKESRRVNEELKALAERVAKNAKKW
jgi:hypothetical protein